MRAFFKGKQSTAATSGENAKSPRRPGDPRASSSFGMSSTKNLLHLSEDADCVRRMYWYAAPMACILLALEAIGLDFPSVDSWFVDVSICLCFAFFLSFLHLFTSRLASVVTLGAGMLVVNLNCERAPKVTLYETHRDAGCRVLRQAISMLGMEAEIRSIPEAVPGIPSPWRDELQAILTAEGREFALPYLVGIDIPEIRAKQGDGAALAKILMQMYCLDPKEAFPLDLSPKLLKTLATVASHIRAYLPWGVTAQPIAWAKVNEARDAANVAAGAVTSPSDTETGGFTIISSPVPSPSSMSSSTSVPVAAALPSPSSSSRALPTPPLTPRTPLSPSLRTLEPTSPSIGSSGVSDSALKLRAQMERQALARENGSAGRSVMVEEELHPVWSIKELQPLLLYGSEASPSCRPVFELLCSLQIPYHLKTCAQGSVHRAGLVLEYGTQWKLPTLVDSNTRRVLIGGTAAVEYMLNTYTDGSK